MEDAERLEAVKVYKGKWRHLRDNYRRKLKQRTEEGRSGAGASKRKGYIYFQCLDFLRHCSEMRPSESNLDPTNTSAEEGEEPVDPLQTQDIQGSPSMDFQFDDEDTQQTVGRATASQTRRGDAGPSVPAPGPSPVGGYRNPPIRRRRGRDPVNVLHEMGTNIQQVLQGLHEQNKVMLNKHSAFGIAMAEELIKVHDALTASVKAKILNIISDAHLQSQQMSSSAHAPPPMALEMGLEQTVQPSLVPTPMARTGRGPPPMATTGRDSPPRGPPPMATTGRDSPPRGPPPMATTGRGSPPRGPPPMATTGRGSPPRGPPPMATTGRDSPPRGPPPMATTGRDSPPRGPPPMASTSRGPPPVASPWRGPPPSASRSRAPTPHSTDHAVWGQYEGWASPSPNQSQFFYPGQTYDAPQSQSAASTASDTEMWHYQDEDPSYTTL